MSLLEIEKLLVWVMFISDVVFVIGYAVIPPRNWYRHRMGWHIVSWSMAFGLLTGTSAIVQAFHLKLSPLIGLIEVALIAGVIVWRTVWMLLLKFVLRRPQVNKTGSLSH